MATSSDQASVRIQQSTQAFGTVGDGVADDTLALQNAIHSGAPVVTVTGTLNVTSTIILASNTTLTIPAGSSIVWGGPAGGTVLASPSDSVLADAGISCQDNGVIDINNAGIGLYLHSHNDCVFDWHSKGGNETSTIVQSISDSTNGANSASNRWLRLRHDNDCGTLLYIAGDGSSGTFNTITSYGYIRCAGNCYVAGIQFGPNCDTNFFVDMISVDLANGATGIKCADAATCYGHHFSDVNIAMYGPPANRVGVYVGSQNRWVQIDKLFIDTPNGSEVDAGGVVANPSATSYWISIGSAVGSFFNDGRIVSLGYTIQALNFLGEAQVSLAPGTAKAVTVPAGAGILTLTSGDSNFSGLLWVNNGSTRAPLALTLPGAQYIVLGNGVLNGGGGTAGRVNINTCTDGNIYISNRLYSETVDISLTFLGATGR